MKFIQNLLKVFYFFIDEILFSIKSFNLSSKKNKVPKLMYKHDGSVLGAVSSVVEMEECIFFGSQLSDRIGYYCPNDQTKKNRTLE